MDRERCSHLVVGTGGVNGLHIGYWEDKDAMNTLQHLTLDKVEDAEELVRQLLPAIMRWRSAIEDAETEERGKLERSST